MGNVKSYSIVGANLVITETLYWTFEANRQDAIQTWALLNFDESSITSEQLENLVSYQDDADFEIEEKQGQKQLCISTYLDQSEYRIICDDLISETRPYNTAELTEIILNYKLHSSKDSELIYKYSSFLERLKIFIENERVKKERILEQVNESDLESVLKSKAKLSLITQIMNIITEFEHKQ